MYPLLVNLHNLVSSIIFPNPCYSDYFETDLRYGIIFNSLILMSSLISWPQLFVYFVRNKEGKGKNWKEPIRTKLQRQLQLRVEIQKI